MRQPSYNSGNATSLTRTGKLDMQNRKPYRTASQKAAAKDDAIKGKDGTFRSTVPVSYHGKPKQVAA